MGQLVPLQRGIDGYLLERLTEPDLDQELNIGSNLQRVKIFRAITNLKRMSNSTSSSQVDGGHGSGHNTGGSAHEAGPRRASAGHPGSERDGGGSLGSLGSPAGSVGGDHHLGPILSKSREPRQAGLYYKLCIQLRP
jgi:hypothetical protein